MGVKDVRSDSGEAVSTGGQGEDTMGKYLNMSMLKNCFGPCRCRNNQNNHLSIDEKNIFWAHVEGFIYPRYCIFQDGLGENEET